MSNNGLYEALKLIAQNIEKLTKRIEKLENRMDDESHYSEDILAKLKDLETLFENHYHKGIEERFKKLEEELYLNI